MDFPIPALFRIYMIRWPLAVILTKVRIPRLSAPRGEIPAFAGMTGVRQEDRGTPGGQGRALSS